MFTPVGDVSKALVSICWTGPEPQMMRLCRIKDPGLLWEGWCTGCYLYYYYCYYDDCDYDVDYDYYLPLVYCVFHSVWFSQHLPRTDSHIIADINGFYNTAQRAVVYVIYDAVPSQIMLWQREIYAPLSVASPSFILRHAILIPMMLHPFVIFFPYQNDDADAANGILYGFSHNRRILHRHTLFIIGACLWRIDDT